MKYVIAPSVLSADFARLGEEVKTVADAGAQYIHLDIMDGVYVPPITFGPAVVKAIRPYTDKVFDAHLMMEEPGRMIEDFADAGADIITVHAEGCRHLDRVLQQISACGKKCGVALNPATPLTALVQVMDQVDMILLMTVNPGYGGQKFIPYTLEKVRTLRAMLNDAGLSTDIEVDGGISLENAETVARAGANILVAGSAVYGGDAAANTRAFVDILSRI
ncbi:MAG: ribulose-phosphate 3-epimerase [Lachnospiraceae bacterium]|nr:ribulose-phosphate 3-epimerase [Lachnospiraceae bacterium]